MAAAAGAWRGLGVGADQEGRRRAAREREACGMGLLEADLEGSDRRRRGSGDLDARRLNQRGGADVDEKTSPLTFFSSREDIEIPRILESQNFSNLTKFI